MHTAAISYRVADFLKQHPPFQGMDEGDLVALAARGRVKFHESDEYLCWQGSEHTPFVLVIQQGTVSLWEDGDGEERLRDIRGAGDMIGIERYTGAPKALYSAKAASEVVAYAFYAADFAQLLTKYVHAARYVDVHASVSADFQGSDQRRGAHQMFAVDLVRHQKPLTCDGSISLREAAERMCQSGAQAIAVTRGSRLEGVLSAGDIVKWVSRGAGDANQPVDGLARRVPATAGPDTAVSESVLAMAALGEPLAITSDGSPGGALQLLLTSDDLMPAFGDNPVAIVHEIGHAASTAALRALNHRARSFILDHLTSPAPLGWLSEFGDSVNSGIVRRVLELQGADAEGCWCFYGAAGRRESLSIAAPRLAAIVPAESAEAAQVLTRIREALAECGYLPQPESHFGDEFLCASIAEWRARFSGWIEKPIVNQIYNARPFFDLRPVGGSMDLWLELREHAGRAIANDGTFIDVLANDCLSSLPPLTFYQDLVVEESGEHTEWFHLGHSALRPLVDVGRVFGLAADHPFQGSTAERLEWARKLVPEHEAIFREAAETLRVVLYHQARAGIRMRTDGSKLSPSLISRHDRLVFKSAFRSIHSLLEFTAGRTWVQAR